MIFIGGATASGKSAVGVALAKEIGGEVVSADSMQIYKYMDIGTAKITPVETEGIPHYMIDVVEPFDTFSVAEYSNMAKEVIKNIESRKKVPIIVGGTGLYINSLLYDYKPSARDENLRNELKCEYEQFGADFMYEKLQTLDVEGSKTIHKNNVKRVLRALEVVILTGKSITDKSDKDIEVRHLTYIINRNREVLYQRINERVDKMFFDGLENEVKILLEDRGVNFNLQSMQAIGYKEFREYFDGLITLENVKELIKQHSRNYAKKQITWFKSIKNAYWFDNCELNEIIEKIKLDYNNN